MASKDLLENTEDEFSFLRPYLEEEEKEKKDEIPEEYSFLRPYLEEQPQPEPVSEAVEIPEEYSFLKPYLEEEVRATARPSFVRAEAPTLESLGVTSIKQAPEESFLRPLADPFLNIGAGINDVVKGFADAFGADNAVSQNLAKNSEWYRSLLSAGAKEDAEEIGRIMQEAEGQGVLAEIGAGLKALTVAPIDLVSQGIGSLIPFIATAGVGKAVGLSRAGVAVLQGVQGGAVGGGIVKGEIYDAVKEQLINSGVDEAKAEKAASEAQAYNGKNLDQIMLGTGLGIAASATGAEGAIRSLITRKVGKEAAEQVSEQAIQEVLRTGFVRGAVKDGIVETATEALQGGQERLAANVAVGREGFDVEPMRGVFGQAALEGALGGVLGGAAGGISAKAEQLGMRESVALRDAAKAAEEAKQSNAPASAAAVEEQIEQVGETLNIPATVTPRREGETDQQWRARTEAERAETPEQRVARLQKEATAAAGIELEEEGEGGVEPTVPVTPPVEPTPEGVVAPVEPVVTPEVAEPQPVAEVAPTETVAPTPTEQPSVAELPVVAPVPQLAPIEVEPQVAAQKAIDASRLSGRRLGIGRASESVEQAREVAYEAKQEASLSKTPVDKAIQIWEAAGNETKYGEPEFASSDLSFAVSGGYDKATNEVKLTNNPKEFSSLTGDAALTPRSVVRHELGHWALFNAADNDLVSRLFEWSDGADRTEILDPWHGGRAGIAYPKTKFDSRDELVSETYSIWKSGGTVPEAVIPMLQELDALVPEQLQNKAIQFADSHAASIGAAPETPNLEPLRRVARAEQTEEDVSGLVGQGLVELYNGQPVITQAGLEALPEAERPRLNPEARKIQIDTGSNEVVAEAIAKNLRIGVDQVGTGVRMPAGWTLVEDIYVPPAPQEVAPEVRESRIERDPDVQKAAQDLKAGTIDRDEYQRIVDLRMPLKKFEEVPIPATGQDMLRGLGERKAGQIPKKELVKTPESIEEGTILESRLDIPAYENENVWVVSLHQPRADLQKGTAAGVVGYTPTAVLRNVEFGVTETAAMGIAAGKPKSTIATMKGSYVPMTAEQAYELANTGKNEGWVEIGMNPIRHSYFYDKETQTPVVSAEEVVQVGGMVLAKNPVYGKREDYRYAKIQMPRPAGMETEAVTTKLESLGFGRGGIVSVVNQPDASFEGRTIIRDGKVVGIELNAAALKDDAAVERVLNHEIAESANADGALNTLVAGLTPKERKEINDAITRLGYAEKARTAEEAARAVELLAAGWKGRRWFERAVARVEAWANKLGYKLTRRAAEYIAARNISEINAEFKQAYNKFVDKKTGDEARYSYAGVTANTPQFMRDSLSVAQAMAAKGDDAETIRSVTGWIVNPYDGKLRWEIPDNNASLTNAWDNLVESPMLGSPVVARLGDILSHPQLFKAYPDIADVTIVKKSPFLDFFRSIQGSYNDVTNEITVTPYAVDPLSTLLHEVQHWIQNKEGFARGSNTQKAMEILTPNQRASIIAEMNTKADDMARLLRVGLDKAQQLRDHLRGIQSMPEKVAAFDLAAQEKQRTEVEWRKASDSMPLGDPVRTAAHKANEAAKDNLWKAAGIDPRKALKTWNIAYPVIHAQSLDQILKKAEEDFTKLEKDISSPYDIIADASKGDKEFKAALDKFGLSNELYRRVAGEIEARDVQSRAGMTPEERAASEPYSSQNIAPELAIVTFASPSATTEEVGIRYSIRESRREDAIPTFSEGSPEASTLSTMAASMAKVDTASEGKPNPENKPTYKISEIASVWMDQGGDTRQLQDMVVENTNLTPANAKKVADAIAKQYDIQQSIATAFLETQTGLSVEALPEGVTLPKEVDPDRPKPVMQRLFDVFMGVRVPPVKIQVNEKTALKQQIRLKAAANRAAKAEQKRTAEEVVEIIKAMELLGPVRPKQVQALAKRAARVIWTSEKSVEAFSEYAAKVVENANYDADLREAKDAQKRAKQLSTQKKVAMSPQREVLEDVSKIPVNKLDDPRMFAEAVNYYLRGFKSVLSPDYVVIPDAEMESYLSGAQSETQRNQRDLDREANERLAKKYGIEPDQVDQMMESIDIIKQIEAQENREALENLLTEKAVETQQGLRGYDTDNLRADQRSIVSSMLKVDPKALDPEERQRFIRITNNIIYNNQTNGAEYFVAVAKGQQSAREAAQDSTMVAKNRAWINLLPRFISERMQRGWALELQSISDTFRNAFGKGAMAKMYDAMGMLDLNLGFTKANNTIDEIQEKIAEFHRNLEKKYKAAARNQDGLLAEGVVGFLIQSVPKKDEVTSINQRRDLIRQDIANRRRSTTEPERGDMADRIETILNQIDGDSVEEILDNMKREFPANHESLIWYKDTLLPQYKDFLKSFDENFNDQANNYENPNYLTIGFTSAGPSLAITPEEQSLFYDQVSLRPKQSAYTIKRVDYSEIPKDRTTGKPKEIEFNLRRNVFNGLSDQINKAYTSSGWQRIASFMKTPEAEEVFGGAANKDFFIERLNRLRLSRMRRGSMGSGGAIEKAVDSLSVISRKLGTGIALGGIYQWIKQPPDQLITAWGSGGRGDLLAKNIAPKTQKLARTLLNKFSIGRRGDASAGYKYINQMEGHQNRLERYFSESKWDQAKEQAGKIADVWMIALKSSDFLAASAAWMTYYEGELNKQDIKIDDWSKEADLIESDPKRRQAAAFAEQMTDIYQGSSDPTSMATFAQSGKTGWENLVKAIFVPFNSFAIQQRMRLYSDARDAISGSKSGVGGLSGTIGGLILFHATKRYVIPAISGAGIGVLYGLMGVDMDEPDEEKQKEEANKNWRQFLADITGNLLVGGTPQIVESQFIDAMNRASYLVSLQLENDSILNEEGEVMSYDQYSKERSPFYRYKSFDNAMSLGMLEIGLGQAEQVALQTKMLATPEEMEMYTPEEQRLLYFSALSEWLYMMRLNDADFARLVGKARRDMMSAAKDREKEIKAIRSGR